MIEAQPSRKDGENYLVDRLEPARKYHEGRFLEETINA